MGEGFQIIVWLMQVIVALLLVYAVGKFLVGLWNDLRSRS